MLLKILMKVNISILQTDIIAGEPEKNFNKTVEILKNLTVTNNHIALLPELWISGYSYDKLLFCSDYFKKNIETLKNIAYDKRINIIGSVPWAEDNNIYNRAIFIDNNGTIKGTYDKIHLFKPLKEDKFFKRGNNLSLIKNKNFNIGIMLCYDLRFPELARKLVIEGADIILVSAEWPLERINHWILLNKARALENQIFIASCNRVGTSYGIKFGGHSMIVAPSGEILEKSGENEEIKTVEIDLNAIKKIKENFNILEDIRLI